MVGSADMGPDELRERLRQFDRAVALLYPGQRFRLVLVGGGAMSLLGYLPRPTSDLDVLSYPRELAPVMAEFGISGRVVAYAHSFAYHFEDRLVPVDFDHEAVACFTASLEDLVASKLCAPRPQDAIDIREPDVLRALDWDRLATVAGEMRMNMLNEQRYQEFVASYDAYRGECQRCDS
jgi:hypothetical protein